MDYPSSNPADGIWNHPLWQEAMWLATTFRCHTTGDAPPVMGLVFGDWGKGVDIFRSWIDDWGNVDEDEAIRVAIIEGDLPNQASGYSVRISAKESKKKSEDVTTGNHLGQVMRMHPLAGMMKQADEQAAAALLQSQKPGMAEAFADMLTPFKEAYLKHREYLLLPTVMKDDGQLWFDVQYGIIKRELVLRHVSEIGEDDPDYPALRATDGSGLDDSSGSINHHLPPPARL